MPYNPNDIQSGSDPQDLVFDIRGAMAAAMSLGHPGYVTGRRYAIPITGAGVGGAVVADTLYAFPIPVFGPAVMSGLSFRVATGVAAVTARMALYSNVAGLPGDLIAECTNDVDCSTTSDEGIGTFASSLSLDGDMYWGAVAYSGLAQPTQAPAAAGGGGLTYYIGASVSNNLFTGTPVCRIAATNPVTYTTGAPFMPATFGPVAYGTALPGSTQIAFIAG